MFVRIYTGSDGQSHFEEITFPFAWDGTVERTPLQGATGVTFARFGVGHVIDWHNAPRRQYVINLSGYCELEVGDGTVYRLGPGDVLLAEDLTGHGHIMRVVGDQPRVSVAIPLGG